MSDVQWIKIKVGMFDGESFKKIKRAKIGGESFRDKLTAVWFELMDFAGQCNHSGAFINSREIAFSTVEDIAIMIDREPQELELCMKFFINEGMVEIVDDVFMLSNWAMYQNEAGLEKIREQKRIAQAKWRAKKKALLESTVDSPVESTNNLPSISNSNSSSTSVSSKDNKGSGEKKEEYHWQDDVDISQKMVSAISDWLEYKKERKEAYKPIGLKALISQIKNNVNTYGEDAVIEVMVSSMGSGYKGICFDKLKNSRGRQQESFNPFMDLLREEGAI